MDYREILDVASKEIKALNGNYLPVIEITKPATLDYAKQLSKVVSKLSPLLGNMIEFSTIDVLNSYDWQGLGEWRRQDPGFPDAIFRSDIIRPNPGIEIKTWFPLATEITARFKDSVAHFAYDQINVAMIAWLPEYVLWGKPIIIDTWIGSASSIAIARDLQYHKPPDYLVFEPRDTSSRTVNLQQTNTNGYKFQGNRDKLLEARRIVDEWGNEGVTYNTSIEYQIRLETLLGSFPYRLDTNYGKMDRIEHPALEEFKTRVLETEFQGHKIRQWSRILFSQNNLLDSELLGLINGTFGTFNG